MAILTDEQQNEISAILGSTIVGKTSGGFGGFGAGPPEQWAKPMDFTEEQNRLLRAKELAEGLGIPVITARQGEPAWSGTHGMDITTEYIAADVKLKDDWRVWRIYLGSNKLVNAWRWMRYYAWWCMRLIVDRKIPRVLLEIWYVG